MAKKKDKKNKKEKKGKKQKPESVGVDATKKDAKAKKGGEKAAKKDAKKDAKKASGAGGKLRALARRIVEQTSTNDDAAILELYAEDVESIEMNMPAAVGRDAIRAKFEGWHSMVSDPEFTATNVWIDGNNIIVEWVGNVTLRATGKRAELREIAIHEIKNGKIARERYYYDPAALAP